MPGGAQAHTGKWELSRLMQAVPILFRVVATQVSTSVKTWYTEHLRFVDFIVHKLYYKNGRRGGSPVV